MNELSGMGHSRRDPLGAAQTPACIRVKIRPLNLGGESYKATCFAVPSKVSGSEPSPLLPSPHKSKKDGPTVSSLRGAPRRQPFAWNGDRTVAGRCLAVLVADACSGCSADPGLQQGLLL